MKTTYVPVIISAEELQRAAQDRDNFGELIRERLEEFYAKAAILAAEARAAQIEYRKTWRWKLSVALRPWRWWEALK